jgi:uncharacterized protein
MRQDTDLQLSHPDLARIFQRFEERLVLCARDHFGHDLVGLLVYGSVARGTMRRDSDLDVMLVLEGLPPTLWERVRCFEPVEAALEFALAEARGAGVDTVVSPLLKSPEELEKGFLLMLDMTEDARILWDRDHWLERALEEFRQRLVKAGARRIRSGASGYWDLKPDFKPGDRVVV